MNGRRRVCMLTGAGGVLGTAFCDRLRAAYDIVAVHRFTPPRAPSQDRALVDPLNPEARLPENEHPVFAVQADVTRPEDVERLGVERVHQCAVLARRRRRRTTSSPCIASRRPPR